MSIKHQIIRRRMRRYGALAPLCGLMTACVATLLGVLNGLDPEIILWRSVISGFALGLLVSFGLSVIYVANGVN